MRPVMKTVFLLALLSTCASVHGQDTNGRPAFRYRFSGYYRSLLTASHSYFTGDAYGDSLNRVRLTADAGWRTSLAVHVDYDNEVHLGNLIGEPDFDLVRDRQSAAYLDLLHVFVNAKHTYWDTSLYRGYLTLRHGGAELTAGRQRIAWGTAHFWSPADVFNPISPLQVEEDERLGVDAAQFALRLPKGVRWSVVYAPQDGLGRSTEATRIGATVHNFDVAALGGRFQRDWLMGADFAGQWRGAGLRGELTYTVRDNPDQANPLRLTFGSDYAIGNKWYVLAEYFYNQGQPPGYTPGQPIDPSILLTYSNEIFTLQRHFVSAGARYSVTPLLNLQTYAVVDLAGPGVLFIPTATYNLTSNTDLSAGGQLFASSPQGEFSRAPNLFNLEFTIHF
jgi:hypothetical protein